jgi:hypothetical protein
MAEETGLIYLLFSSPWVFAPGRSWFGVARLRDGGEEPFALLRLRCVSLLCWE